MSNGFNEERELIEALSSEDTSVRSKAASTLGQIGKPAKAAIPLLIEALDDKANKVRINAAYALGQIGEEANAAVHKLVALSKDADEDVRRHAATALSRIDVSRAIPVLKNMLEDNSIKARSDASIALRRIETPEAMESLEQGTSEQETIMATNDHDPSASNQEKHES